LTFPKRALEPLISQVLYSRGNNPSTGRLWREGRELVDALEELKWGRGMVMWEDEDLGLPERLDFRPIWYGRGRLEDGGSWLLSYVLGDI
jgi:hypothetical protein